MVRARGRRRNGARAGASPDTTALAVHGLLYLATQPPLRLVPLGEIAAHCGVRPPRLEHAFARLARARLLRRAPSGWQLARGANAISPLDVARCLEGDPCDSGCVLAAPGCDFVEDCPLGRTWVRACRAACLVLGSVSLADLVGKGPEPERG